MAEKKVVLAYSGGLDTSCILKWLLDKNYDTIAFIANVGQKDDFKDIEKKAIFIGATKVYVEDLRREFIEDFIFPAIRGNAAYEGRYLLGTSLARPLIAKKQVEIAHREEADYVAHGATGKGNDQIRFELTYAALDPNLKVIAPWKDEEFLNEFQGRSDLIKYARKKKIPVKATLSEPWSTDPNLMHISYEAGELEDPRIRPRELMFEWTKSPMEAPDKETKIDIFFENGNPVKIVQGKKSITGALEIFEYLNKLGSENGVGRIDIVENRFVGMKSRGVYETPAGTILHIAHRDIEGITMDREVMHLRDSLTPKFSELIYYGFWYSPEMEFLKTAFDKSQEYVNGAVKLSLYKGNVIVIGRSSKDSLYHKKIVSMHFHGDYDQKDAIGFIKLNALRLKTHSLRKMQKKCSEISR